MILKKPAKTPLHLVVDDLLDNMMLSFHFQASSSDCESIEIVKMIFRRQLTDINKSYPRYAQIESRKLNLCFDHVNGFVLSSAIAGLDNAPIPKQAPIKAPLKIWGFFSTVRGAA